jgi:hypothetical protein
MTVTPLPMSAKSGAGHAPVKTRPTPKIVPPSAYLTPCPSFFSGAEMMSPEAEMSFARLIKAREIAAFAIAARIIPYIRND